MSEPVPEKPEWLANARDAYIQQLAKLPPPYLKILLKEDIARLTPRETHFLFQTACTQSTEKTIGSPVENRRMWRNVRKILWNKAMDGLDTPCHKNWESIINQWLDMEQDAQILTDIGNHPRWTSKEKWTATGEQLKHQLKQKWQECPPQQIPWAFHWWNGVWEMNQMERVTACAEGLYQHFYNARHHLPTEDQTWKHIVQTLKTTFPNDLPLIRQILIEKLQGPVNGPAIWNAFRQIGGGEVETQLQDWLRHGLQFRRDMSREELDAASRWKPENKAVQETVRTLWQEALESGGKDRRCTAAAALLNLGQTTSDVWQRIMQMMKRGEYPFLFNTLCQWDKSTPTETIEFKDTWKEAWMELLNRAYSPDSLRLEREFIWRAILQQIPETVEGTRQICHLLETFLHQETLNGPLNVIADALLQRKLPDEEERRQLYQTGLTKLLSPEPERKTEWIKALLYLLPEDTTETETSPLWQEMERLTKTQEGLKTLGKMTLEAIRWETGSATKPFRRQSLLQNFWESQLHTGTDDGFRQSLDCLRQMVDIIPDFVAGERVWAALKQPERGSLSPGQQVRANCLEMKLVSSNLEQMPAGWRTEFWKKLILQERTGTGETVAMSRLLRQNLILSDLETWMDTSPTGRCDLAAVVRHLRQQCHLRPDELPEIYPGGKHETPGKQLNICQVWGKLWEEVKAAWEKEAHEWQVSLYHPTGHKTGPIGECPRMTITHQGGMKNKTGGAEAHPTRDSNTEHRGRLPEMKSRSLDR